MLIKIGSEYEKVSLKSSEHAYKTLLAAFLTLDKIDQDKEHMFVIGLKRNHRIRFLDLVHTGTLTSTQAHAREIFRRAVIQASASVIIGHNHPSGSVLPSTADDRITQSLKEAGKLIDITLLDHIIFTLDEYCSYADNGKL